MPPDPRQGEARELLPEAQLQELGRILSEGRVASGRSLEDLALQLHMGVEQLRALEKADCAKLPELVFVIAQARRIASILELRIDHLIEELRQGSLRRTKVTSSRSKAKPAPPSPRHGGVRQVVSGAQPQASSPPGSEAQGQPERTSGAASPPWRSGSLGTWLQPLAALALLAGVISAGTALWRHRVPAVGLTPSTPASTSVAVVRPAAPRPVIASTQLVLRSKKPSWLEVRTSQGHELHFGILRGQRSFPNTAGLLVRAGRPDLITVATATGTPRLLGRIDQLRWWLIRPDGRILPLPGKPA